MIKQPDDMINRLRTYKNGVHGAFFLEVADELKRLDSVLSAGAPILEEVATRIEELESENEDLHLENDTLFLRLESGMPWADLAGDGWRIVGMNHYNLVGKTHLFCSMARDGRCITAEADNEALVFQKLAELAKQQESV